MIPTTGVNSKENLTSESEDGEQQSQSSSRGFSLIKVSLSIHYDFCCVSVCDGCGRGHNEVAGCVQNHHVHISFHRNGHIKSFVR